MERKAFPRGGGTEDQDEGTTKSFKSSHWLPVQKKKSRPKKSKDNNDSDPEEDFELEERLRKETEKSVVISSLSYKSVQPGMKLLGRVAEIHDEFIQVYLPGSIIGTIPHWNVIDMMKNLGLTFEGLKNFPALKELVKVDQLVISRVCGVVKNDNPSQKRISSVLLTVNPKDIYEGWTHSMVAEKGFFLQGVVRSIEDYGYILDCGIKDLFVFLNNKECVDYCNLWNSGKPLVKGQMVYGVVIKARTADVASQVELSIDPQKVSKASKTPTSDVQNVSQLLPGMRFELDIVKKLSNGVRVISDRFEGFVVDRNMPHSRRGFDLGRSRLGCLLYVSKPLNVPMFSFIPSLVDSSIKPSRELNFGDIVKKALVESTTIRGVGLILCKTRGIKGFVPPQYKKNAGNETGSKDIHQVGKVLSCRVLNFDSLTETYLCTTAQSALEERYFSLADVPVGKKVTATVKSVSEKGVYVNVGAVSGYIPWQHTADLPTRSIGDKFHKGMKVRGRVLRHLPDRIIITAKETLVKKGCKLLKSCDQAAEGEVYYGTLLGVENNRYKVSFFGDVVGFLPMEQSDRNYGKSRIGNYGRLVKCCVSSVENELLLSLSDCGEELQVGLKCSPIVSGINLKEKILHVLCGSTFHAHAGIIPVYHLHDDPKLADALFRTYSIGSIVENARCYNNGSNPIFSACGSVRRFFESDVGEAVAKEGSKGLQIGNIIPCFVKAVPQSVSTFIILSTPFSDSNFTHRIGHEYLELKKVRTGDYVPLIVKDVENRVYDGRVSALWKNEINTSAEYLSDIMEGNSRLEAEATKAGSVLSVYSVGQTVSGPVESAESGCKVLMPNGVKGHANLFCIDEPLQVGQIVSGKVIFVDYLRSELILTLEKKVCDRLVPDDSPIVVKEGTALSGKIVRGFSDFFLAVVEVKNEVRRAFVPKHVYPCPGAAKLMKKILVGETTRFTVVQKFDNNLLVCVPKACVKRLKLKFGQEASSHAEEDVKDEVSADELRDAESEDAESIVESVDAESEDAKSNSKRRRRRRKKNSVSSDGAEGEGTSVKETDVPKKKKSRKANADHVEENDDAEDSGDESTNAQDSNERSVQKKVRGRRRRKNSVSTIKQDTVKTKTLIEGDECHTDSLKRKKKRHASTTDMGESSTRNATGGVVAVSSGSPSKKIKKTRSAVESNADSGVDATSNESFRKRMNIKSTFHTDSKRETPRKEAEKRKLIETGKPTENKLSGGENVKGKALNKSGSIQKLGVKKTQLKKKALSKVGLPKKMKDRKILSAIVESVTGSGDKSPLVRSSDDTKLSLKKNLHGKRRSLVLSSVRKRLPPKSLKKSMNSK